MMKPFPMNTEEVRGTLDGRKTVTRRVMKPQPTEHLTCGPNWKELLTAAAAPYRPGDVLWVRETWAEQGCKLLFKADFTDEEIKSKTHWFEKEQIHLCDLPRWRPSIHMPRESARLFLRVTGVRVERLQAIDVSSCTREGVTWHEYPCAWTVMAKPAFIDLWNSTIKKPDLALYGWDANPWVWVIDFKRCEKP